MTRFPLTLLGARLFGTCLLGLLAGVPPAVAAATDWTPPAFLTDIQGGPALSWVKAHNARTLHTLQSDPRYGGLYAQALHLGESRDRIAEPSTLAGRIYNFWQDPSHVRGIWRSTTLASYRSAKPAWRTAIDLDALSKSEHANWVWKGVDCIEPKETRCLVELSDGGEDAVTVREYDLAQQRFVPGGFTLPRSKQDFDWEDDNTLLVARDWGPGTMTPSSYAFIVKRLHRGQPLSQATLVYAGQPTDMEVTPVTMVDGDGHRISLITRALSFFAFEYRLITPNGLVLLDLPKKSTLEGFVAGQLIVKIAEDWTPKAGKPVAPGSLVSLDIAHPDAAPQIVFSPSQTQALDTVGITRHAVLAALTDNVRGQAWRFLPSPSGWQATRLQLPDNLTIDVADTTIHDDHAFLDVTGFLEPPQLWRVDAMSGQSERIKTMPAQFDAQPYRVDQYEAASSDGTQIPYFVVHRKDMALNGSNPTLLYAYGGFEVSMTPTYNAVLGKLWLGRGGVYVLANIRGGGEFGPRWHEAGLQTKRQHIYDDFAAVGRDLVTRHITSPDKLGIRGGSNGGLLMGVEFTQHPELWHAVIIDVPLLDMLHFETMSAGASWVGEYGSVSNPEQRAFLAHISPLQALRQDVSYPEPYIFTTTKDDRVGPVHARRFAAKMEQLGLPFLYFEQIEGGHAAGANLREKAEEQALEYTYLSQKLMP